MLGTAGQGENLRLYRSEMEVPRNHSEQRRDMIGLKFEKNLSASYGRNRLLGAKGTSKVTSSSH